MIELGFNHGHCLDLKFITVVMSIVYLFLVTMTNFFIEFNYLIIKIY